MDWNTLIPGCVSDGYEHLTCLPAVFKNLIDAALIFAGAVTVYFIIIAGFRLVTSRGDQQKVSKARQTLTFAIIGLVIILISFFIVTFIGAVTGTGNCIDEMGFSHCQ